VCRLAGAGHYISAVRLLLAAAAVRHFGQRLWPLLAVCTAGLLAAMRIYTGVDIAILAFTVGLAVLLWALQRRVDALEQEARLVRDSAREANLALAQKNEALQQAQDANVKLATLSERGRIAREIHDNVGHMLARSMMQVGAVMTVNSDPTVAEGLTQLKDTLTLAMNSVRESVHDLRDDAVDLYETVAGSLRDFSAYDTNLNYDMGHDAPAPVKACFAAVTHEALANIARHSNATRIQISLQEHPRFYQLAIADNGTGLPQKPAAATGMGLENMRLRTAALGGRFTVRRQNGFSIHITIPKAEGEKPHDADSGR